MARPERNEAPDIEIRETLTDDRAIVVQTAGVEKGLWSRPGTKTERFSQPFVATTGRGFMRGWAKPTDQILLDQEAVHAQQIANV